MRRSEVFVRQHGRRGLVAGAVRDRVGNDLPGMMSFGLRLNVVPASSRQTGIEPGVPANAAGFR